MTEISELRARLRDLTELSKTKKYQLAKTEQEEALAVLSALCSTDDGDYSTTIEALADFPSEVGAAFLALKWTEMMEEKVPVFRDLRSSRFGTDLGKRLRISLAQRLLKADPESALRLLLDTFRTMKPEKKRTPVSKDLKIIRSALIEPASHSLGKLPTEGVRGSDLALLTTYILSGAFVRRKSQRPLPIKAQLAVIRWANSFSELAELPQEVENAITQTVKTWDRDFRGILAREISGERVPLQKLLAFVCQTDMPKESSTVSQEPSPSSEAKETAQVQPVEPQQPYDASKEIGRLAQYVRGLEDRIRQSWERSQAVDRSLQQTRSELLLARREIEETRGQILSERDKSRRLADEKDVLEKDIVSLRGEIEKLSSELATARDQHQEAQEFHGRQLDALSERIAHEGEHRVNTLRNKLGARLQAYADALRESSDMEMTVELGTALRNQMGQLLQLLRVEGFRIDGGQ